MSKSSSSSLLRDTPDGGASSAPHPYLFLLLSWLTGLLVYLILPLYIPYLTIQYLLTPRPFPRWTLRRFLRQRTNKLWVHISQWWLPVEESFEEAWWVEAMKRPGFMLSPKGARGRGVEKAKVGEKVFLHIHGGGYIRGHPLWQDLVFDIVNRTNLRLFSVNYRKCVVPANAFPAPLLDALAAYLYLTNTLLFPASSIVLLAESAGGHLSFLLTRYLSESALPIPRTMILSSPWVDFTFFFPSYTTHKPFDSLHVGRLSRPSALGKPEDWAYLVKEEVRVYMQVGTRERFEDEIRKVGRDMKDAGVDVILREDVDGIHTGAVNDPGAREQLIKDICEILGVD
ncbi:hypothetical protein EHS25_009058 [Saitozyma podzolica]|uniref:Alpha/beta hydrolase fold-3 domain-containing protein n=1 Tax=Saitozyma podzolica TaxID=1890683 RepID=A0A427YKU6_9TREE|nr:hypothetical protein EHS25_009058 [Saitozyma podzolica]